MTPHYVDSKIMIYKIKCGPYDNNAYLLVCQQTGESLIIDTPSDPEELISIASTTQVKGVLITHNHMDHLLGFDEVTSVFDVPIGIGTDDASALKEDAALLLEDDTKIDVGIIEMGASKPGEIEAICKIIKPNIVASTKNITKYIICMISSFIKLTMSIHPPTLVEPFCISLL